MSKPIVGIGDSFIYGTDLSNGYHSAWPALIASKLNASYTCCAFPGIGNTQILANVLDNITTHGNKVVYAINWTWIDRHDYFAIINDRWQTIRPDLVDPHCEYYYKNLHSELQDKFQTLACISLAIKQLEHFNCRYVMTYMDPLMLSDRWHSPSYVKILQKDIIEKLSTFNGLDFRSWSQSLGYPESATWHPLDQAHQAAAEYWVPFYKKLTDE